MLEEIMTRALFAFRDDAGFMLKFMGIVPADYGVDMFISELDDKDQWPESHYALYIDLETFEVIIFDEADIPEEFKQVCSLSEILEQALKECF